MWYGQWLPGQLQERLQHATALPGPETGEIAGDSLLVYSCLLFTHILMMMRRTTTMMLVMMMMIITFF